MTIMLELGARLRILEDLEAIRKLKARYFFCCDQKDPQGVRDCFAPGKVLIDYGRIGVFHDRDQLAEVFERLGCQEHIVEMHHGENPQITIVDDTNARGTWGLYYHLINTRERSITQLGAYYEDEYRKLDNEWKISKTRCVVTSTLVMDLADGMAKILFAGRAAPVAVDDPIAPSVESAEKIH
ncbi:nuclear transport factor 2 family protein [Undibacterium arcticum]|uniref:Nuclear transport factor 2 family protein n=1 Tax=Undibacterium arcticum TaxID=1762892 RepID=A0ABV7EUZ0_9BURK